ncbi:flagellar assembly protein FliW [Peribacillus saganii]|uniref:Flagellar assembly factor FliW n=1 Tax=Peribacillus saganii TaxID=2303992 RepID=A0A372LNF5_9BACI|nr:flagellar assembly protein FliW [Peribacillus saganii]RFU68298.1 flagellar assembly protein FliW [Peribacillus saganii]
MKLLTKYHGEVEFDQSEIITFAKGIPGFPDETQFIMFPLAQDTNLLIMQSVQTSQLAFVIVSPFDFYKEYDFILEQSVVDQLELESPEQAEVYAILSIKDPFELTTANLQAPVIINKTTLLAKQVILNHPSYKTKHFIIPKKSKPIKER